MITKDHVIAVYRAQINHRSITTDDVTAQTTKDQITGSIAKERIRGTVGPVCFCKLQHTVQQMGIASVAKDQISAIARFGSCPIGITKYSVVAYATDKHIAACVTAQRIVTADRQFNRVYSRDEGIHCLTDDRIQIGGCAKVKGHPTQITEYDVIIAQHSSIIDACCDIIVRLTAHDYIVARTGRDHIIVTACIRNRNHKPGTPLHHISLVFGESRDSQTRCLVRRG